MSGSRPLRILHVGSGFRPMRRGGLVAYIEDLMQEQTRRGHDVTYLFSGRYYPWLRRPRLRRWRRGKVRMLEIVGSPLYDHGRQPQLELAEPRTERIFERVLGVTPPDVVHIQELAGLPSSLLDISRRSGLPTVMTLQDYFPLCSTFRLFDADGRVCMRRQVGEDCVATVVADPREPDLLFEATLLYELRRLSPKWRYRIARRLRRLSPEHDPPRDPAAFQRRRDLNVERLNGIDRLVAMSTRVAEIYAELGVDSDRLRAMQLTLAHIERLHPRRFTPGGPVTFATLGGGESVEKGSRLLLDAVRLLEPEARAGRFRLLVLGYLEPEVVREAPGLAGLELRQSYAAAELDSLLDEVDVGIMPSIWEEAYGYAGMEFLAKGIPVIGNAIGGIVDYVRPGETGWLNRSHSPEELAALMRSVIEHPDHIERLNASLLANRASLVKPFARHADEVEALYREVIAARNSRSAETLERGPAA